MTDTKTNLNADIADIDGDFCRSIEVERLAREHRSQRACTLAQWLIDASGEYIAHPARYHAGGDPRSGAVTIDD